MMLRILGAKASKTSFKAYFKREEQLKWYLFAATPRPDPIAYYSSGISTTVAPTAALPVSRFRMTTRHLCRPGGIENRDVC